MGVASDIALTVWPVAAVGGIAVFVVLRMKKKYEKGTLGKKNTKQAQTLLDCLIPFGMMGGLAAGVLLSLFLPVSFLATMAWGPGIGLLCGYVAYEMYSRQGENQS